MRHFEKKFWLALDVDFIDEHLLVLDHGFKEVESRISIARRKVSRLLDLYNAIAITLTDEFTIHMSSTFDLLRYIALGSPAGTSPAAFLFPPAAALERFFCCL